jgi:hypothetical protein
MHGKADNIVPFYMEKNYINTPMNLNIFIFPNMTIIDEV